MTYVKQVWKNWRGYACGTAFAWLSMLALLATAMQESHAALEVSSKRECAICHIMWLDDFKRDDVATLVPYDLQPVESTGKQDVESTEHMCFSCHDGFSLDSRATWMNRHNFHSVGVKPSDKVNIPRKDGKLTFPLNQDGKVYCGTCHSAHGLEWGEEMTTTIFLRMKNKDSSICVACHVDRSTGSEEGNHPVFKKIEAIPESLRAAGVQFGEDDTLICQTCHLVHGAPEKNLLALNNSRSELCGGCHENRNPKDMAQAQRMGTHPVNVAPDQAKIPKVLLDKGSKLSADGMVICATCHKSHFAENGTKILVASNAQSELCKTCHVDQRKVAKSKHNMGLVDEKARNINDQEVGKAGVCSACHVSHGGSGPKMWAQPIKPGGIEPMADLCLSCHKDSGLAEKFQVGTFTHPVGREMSRLKEQVDFPGFTHEGVKATGKNQGNVTCATCHDAHQWDPADPEKTSKPGDKSDASNNFLRKANGPDSPLCRVCHKDNARIKDTKHDMTVMFPNERNVKGQTSVEAGICGNCHLTHNGKGPRMWAREAVAGVDPASSICLNCHNTKGLAKDSLIGTHSHPVDVPMTNIGINSKDGKWVSDSKFIDRNNIIEPLPLFDKAGVPQTEGGNVACGTCHDPHNWSTIAHADEGKDPHDIKGSGLTNFLRIPNDSKGKLCSNCHVDKGPISLSKHNLAISVPAEKNIKGKTTDETGVCGACHLVHNGNTAKMWARNTGSGKDEIEKACNSCHEKGQNAEKKVTGDNSHPLGSDLKKVGKTTLPLYTADGKRDDAVGKVGCATCHNLHQWNPMDANSNAGATAEIEGDAETSFLRLPAWPTPDLCADCHQDQRLVKGTEHDLAITAPDETNALKQNRQQSGLCGSCHVPHNAVVKAGLWARDLGKGADVNEGLCRSCHAEDKVASDKQPLKYTHPGRVKIVSNPAMRRTGAPGSDSHFPVYTKDGRSTVTGYITCSSCHNPHRWIATQAEEGPGKNVEGDATNSFLRNRSAFSLCTNCHGLDALYRYQYYHGKSSRSPRSR